MNIISFILLVTILFTNFFVAAQNIELSSVVTDREKQIIEHEKDLRRHIDGNWKQEKLFKHEDLSCCYNIELNKDKTLKAFDLQNIFCDVSNDKECVVFLKVVKQSIIDSFSNTKVQFRNQLPLRVYLCFGSDKGNKIYLESLSKNKP